MVKKIKDRRGVWIFVAPISNLILTEAVNYEYRVDKVTFVDTKVLSGRRKRFGFPLKLSFLKKRWEALDRFFSISSTVATLRLTGMGSDLESRFLRIVHEELAILSLSQLGYCKRLNNSKPSIARENPSLFRSYLLFNSSDRSWTQPNRRLDKFQDLILNPLWLRFQKQVFFDSLIKYIQKETRISRSCKNDIVRSAILAGQSQCCSDVPQCFLWNMIAIEILLCRQGDRYREELPKRAEAFLGWSVNWEINDYQSRIREVYKKRSKFVHDGVRDITIDDVLFTDELLLNVFINILRHPHYFPNKDVLIDFSEKVAAEKLLGIKSKIQPKTLLFVNINYSERDRERI